jgi:hypothetical protein
VQRTLGSLAVIAIAVALTACDGSPSNHTVGIVGDSITNLSACVVVFDPHGVHCVTPFTTEADGANGAIGYAFADTYAEFLDAWSGQPIARLEPYVAQHASDGDHVMIVELGTIDAVDGNLDWQSDYQRVLGDVSDTPCVVLVTVPYFADTVYANANGGTRLNIAKKLDTLIASTVAANPNMRLVDYAAHLRKTRGFSTDGIHPTALESQQWVADQYRTATDSCP